MATDNIWGPVSIPASADLSASQFCFMKIGATGLALPSSGGFADTILQDKPAALDAPGQICRPGDISKVVCGGNFNRGDLLATDGSGKATWATSGQYILARALEAGVTGALARVRFLGLYSKF